MKSDNIQNGVESIFNIAYAHSAEVGSKRNAGGATLCGEAIDGDWGSSAEDQAAAYPQQTEICSTAIAPQLKHQLI